MGLTSRSAHREADPATASGRRASGTRRGPGSWYRALQSARFLLARDRRAVLGFLRQAPVPAPRRLRLLIDCLRVTQNLRGYHSLAELLDVGLEVLARDRPLVVECGVGKGSSTCKLSLFVREAGGELHAFDSFRGMPANDEEHRHLDGRTTRFREGAFRGRLAEVERSLQRFGAPEVTRLHKGWFEDVLDDFVASLGRPIDVVLLDVDLERSTRTCLAALWRGLAPDAVVFSQDGHLVRVVDVLADAEFWRRECGTEPPRIDGLGLRKLVVMRSARHDGVDHPEIS